VEKFSSPAVVIGGGSVTGLGAIRSLGRAGIDVYYVEEEKSAGIYSKYCKMYVVSPKISHNEEELKNILLKIEHQTGHSAVLFPASDLYALYLSDLVDELRSYCMLLPKRETLELLVNKKSFYQSLKKENIPIPATYFPEDLENARKIAKEISYPIFIKPYFSHLFREQFGGSKKGFVANSQDELISYYALMMRRGIDVMIQDVITGSSTDHVFLDGYLDRNLNPKVLFARRRLRMWPLAFGNSSLCTSIPISEVASLKEPLFRYLKSIDYRGIFSAEFKKDDRDNTFKLLEINARTSGWFNTLSATCGCNIMLIAYLDAIGRDTKYIEDYEAGVKLMLLRDDVQSSTRMFMNGDLSIREWISSLSGKKVYSPYAGDDLMPFIIDVSRNVKSIIKHPR